MGLKEEIVGACTKCPDGFIERLVPCECMKRFRVYNRLIDGGFYKNTLDIVYNNYEWPEIESGENFVKYFLDNVENVEKKGLSLYIYSKDRGRGKTTLAHFIMSQVVSQMSDLSLYSSHRSYAFEDAHSLLINSKDDSFEKPMHAVWYVLDDLGNEPSTPAWKKEQMISELQKMLQYRRNHQLPTIITSNYSPEDLSGRYEGVLDSLLEIQPSGDMGGQYYRPVKVSGAEDLRLSLSQWEV